MRGLRRIIGIGLILLGSSGLALTAIVIQDADPVDVDALASPTPSLDGWAMGLVFVAITAAGVWTYRIPRR